MAKRLSELLIQLSQNAMKMEDKLEQEVIRYKQRPDRQIVTPINTSEMTFQKNVKSISSPESITSVEMRIYNGINGVADAVQAVTLAIHTVIEALQDYELMKDQK